MPLNHTDTDVQTLRINSFATLADYQAAYGQGLIDSSEISFIDEPIQADWNQAIGTAPDFIRNKPTIPDAVSGTHDGTDWTTLTIGSVTKSIPSGGSGGGGGSSTLSGLDDTLISSPSDGQVLVYNETASKWVNGAAQASTQVGTLNTNNSSALSVNSSESLSGTVSLHKVAKTGTYSDLIGTPTIPTVNDATLTIQRNGSAIGTFSANSSVAKTVNIEVPAAQVNSDWNSTSGVSQILNKPTLSTVATSGSYNDLADKPTIPAAANSGILSIQKNSATIGTFGANDSGSKSINIEVPTTAADVNALASSTKYGSSISLTMGTSDFVVTAQLKDQDGNNLGSSQTIDLPLESVVVNGSYDNTTKKVILTLKNGSTVDFSVADLVSGLQSEITSSNKLSADLVQDGTTNKVFTSTEKTKLSGIAEGAEVNVQSDWNQTTATADDYIKNKPTIPTVGTLNTNNSTAQTATTESLSGTVNLHKVAKTGSYSDLIGTPAIPTVNNSTITIQKNGTNVDSFTTNASSGKNINIQVSELPSVSASDNGKVLQVVNGIWTLVTPVTVYIGSGTPSNSIGTNGDIYLQN